MMQSLKHEINKISSLALFFLFGFGYILLILKLFIAEYSIDIYVLSKAIIGALVAAKAVAIMDATPLLNRFKQAPRYLRVLYKTFIYTLAVLILGIVERFFHAYHQTKGFISALKYLLESGNIYHFTGVILCILIVFFIHNIFREIDNYLGKGNLKKIFFNSPRLNSQNSNIPMNKN